MDLERHAVLDRVRQPLGNAVNHECVVGLPRQLFIDWAKYRTDSGPSGLSSQHCVVLSAETTFYAGIAGSTILKGAKYGTSQKRKVWPPDAIGATGI